MIRLFACDNITSHAADREILNQVMDEMPGDPTNLEDMLHATLLSAQPEQALQYAYELDPWLSAHMADIMDALGTIPRNDDE